MHIIFVIRILYRTVCVLFYMIWLWSSGSLPLTAIADVAVYVAAGYCENEFRSTLQWRHNERDGV